jgi:D-tyrosyl-tRNA(Tyr) deacylase
MRILLQRVSRASVSVGGEVIGEIGRGMLAFVGIRDTDTEEIAKWMAEKVANLRIFEDSDNKMNLSVKDISGSVLVVSQFTLYGDANKGNRPSFVDAAPPEKAEVIYEIFLGYMKARLWPEKVASGRFRAMMQVELVNEGPVTILLER